MAETYVVKKVLGKSVNNGAVYYLIEWDGFPGQDTWEPKDNCDECMDSVNSFEEALRIHLKRLKRKIKDGKASTEETIEYNKTKSKSYSIQIDPDMYLKNNSKKKDHISQNSQSRVTEENDKYDEKKVIKVLAYKPEMGVYHVKYDDGDDEYVDRVFAIENFDQQIIRYYENYIVPSCETNRRIAQEFPRYLSLPGILKPSFLSDLIVQNDPEELVEPPKPDLIVQDDAPPVQIPKTPHPDTTTNDHDSEPNDKIPLSDSSIQDQTVDKDEESHGEKEVTNTKDEDILNKYDLEFLSSLDLDFLDQTRSQDTMVPQGGINEIVQRLLKDVHLVPNSPMTTPYHVEENSLPISDRRSTEQSISNSMLGMSIDGSSAIGMRQLIEPDPNDRFVIEFSDEEI